MEFHLANARHFPPPLPPMPHHFHFHLIKFHSIRDRNVPNHREIPSIPLLALNRETLLLILIEQSNLLVYRG